MIVDSGTAPYTPAGRYDVCVAGGGVAGIVLARRLAGHGRRVLVLEGGALEPTHESQDLYRGRNVGHAYLELDECRLRYLGGTSNHWAGWCRPLDAEDFRARPQIAESGWPITQQDLEPYLDDAREMLEIPPFGPDQVLAGSGGRLRNIAKHRSPPVRFGAKYLPWLQTEPRVQLLLRANLVDIELSESGTSVAALLVAGAEPTAPRLRVSAEYYVLALGGIENPRVLLNADRQASAGIGNDAGLVGRYFMDHPHFDIGYYVLGESPGSFGTSARYVALTPEAMKADGVAGAHVQVKPILAPADDSDAERAPTSIKRILCASEVIDDFMRTTGISDCSTLSGAGRLRIGSEQVPNADSRVRLGHELDAYGLRRVELDWQPLPLDMLTVRTAAYAVAEYFARADVGRVRLFNWVMDPEQTALPGWETADTLAASHHIGTTRMATHAGDGVVDANCRVFGLDNLFIAGSSVFRTSGVANPTLSIVQLALRLADHLATRAQRA